MAEYIYKDEAFAIIENKQREICPMGRYSRAAVYGSDREAFDNWQEILDEIEAIPSADVAPVRHARWVKIYENGEPKVEQHQIGVFCSKCMNMPKDRFTESDYCPNCGAKMDESKV